MYQCACFRELQIQSRRNLNIQLATQEGNWNNQGYGNLDANENMKSIVVNGPQQFYYIITAQRRQLISFLYVGSDTRCKILHRTAIPISAVGFIMKFINRCALQRLIGRTLLKNVLKNVLYYLGSYGVSAFDFTMKLSRGSLDAKYPQTRCYPLEYR